MTADEKAGKGACRGGGQLAVAATRLGAEQSPDRRANQSATVRLVATTTAVVMIAMAWRRLLINHSRRGFVVNLTRWWRLVVVVNVDDFLSCTMLAAVAVAVAVAMAVPMTMPVAMSVAMSAVMTVAIVVTVVVVVLFDVANTVVIGVGTGAHAQYQKPACQGSRHSAGVSFDDRLELHDSLPLSLWRAGIAGLRCAD